MNRGVLENLKRGGDDLSKPRRVFHWLYFATETDRERCAAAARERGFGTSMLPTAEKPDNKFPLGLQLHRIDSVVPREIDALTLALYDLAQDHSGNYDGWETQIVKAGAEPADDAPAASG
jgi:regulator of RNase E activity RraB